MTLIRVDQMQEVPLPGRFYLVPTINELWHGHRSDWPVIGPLHKDIEFFNFTDEHYHIDGRFLNARQRKIAGSQVRPTVAEEIQAAPLHHEWRKPDSILPKPILKKLKCWKSDIPYGHHDKKQVQDIQKHYAGQSCANGKSGWICPHRKASLGSIAPVNGVITCPLHGMRIDAETGKVLSL